MDDSSQDESGKDMEALVQDGDGGESQAASGVAPQEPQESQGATDPLYVQKRLKQQKRSHDREMREMQARMAEMQARMPQSHDQSSANSNPYEPQMHASSAPGNIDEAIHKAVGFALQHRDMEERKAKDAQSAAHISKQYQELQSHLDKTADKYDDFDDVVRGNNAPFTPHMRDASLMLPKQGAGSAGEVLYKLGKNPEELDRISKLHPVDQAAEMVKLSHALISGGDHKGSSPRPLGQIKANPISNSSGVNDKTPPSAIRALMKAGKFK